MLDRRDFVRQLLLDRGDLLVVSGLGSATYDAAPAGDHPLNFYLWGAMGGAAMIGLGLALSRPDRRVAVLTGDGDMLMGLGSLATIGVKQPKNLCVVVLDNRHYGETGMQPSHTHAGIDLVATALACRFRQARTVSRPEEADAMRAFFIPARGRSWSAPASLKKTWRACCRCATAMRSNSGLSRRSMPAVRGDRG